MGFSLESMFEELIALLESDEKAAKKIKKLRLAIYEAKRYAEVCGQLN